MKSKGGPRHLAYDAVLAALEARAEDGTLPYWHSGDYSIDGNGRDRLDEAWAPCPVLACDGTLKVEDAEGKARIACLKSCKRADVIEALAIPEPDTSWRPVDLGPVLTGDVTEPAPEILERADGATALLYPGRSHQASAEPEACKGWLATKACAELVKAGRRALYIDFEDTAASIVARLRALGCDAVQIANHFTYLRPHEPLTAGSGQADLDAALALKPELVVIDGVTEALTIHGLDLADNADIARWLDLLPRRAMRSGAAVLLIDHVVKDKESRGRYGIGAQHKLAGVDVAYTLEVVEPFGRGRDGLVRVLVKKDRPGHVRQHADAQGRIADMRLRSDADTGSVSVELDAPEGSGEFRPTVLMGRLWRAIDDEPGIGVKALRAAVKGNNEAKAQGLRLLLEEDYVRVEVDGQARRHHTLKPFIEEAETPNRAPVPEPCPDRAQAPSSTTVPRAPSSVGGHGKGHEAEQAPDRAHAHCFCSRPSASPRADGPDVCWKCKKPILAPEGAA